MTAKEDWKKISATHPGRLIEPIPYTRANQLFGVNLWVREIEAMKDKNSNIRYNKIFKWMLPTFDGKLFRSFLAATMQSYMTHLMLQG
jgi:hypothetical protein